MVYKLARRIFKRVQARTKRKPYLRSAYFNDKNKIFFDYFWIHLSQKPPKERMRRLRFFEAALELIRHSRYHPHSIFTADMPGESFHRFGGMTKRGTKFFVQIKEHKRTGRKQFMSVFPKK